MIRPHRRDFVLDSGGVSTYARNEQAQIEFFKFVAQTYVEPAVLIPSTVLTESFTGYPTDAPLNRLLKTLADPSDPNRFLLFADLEITRRAGALRTDGMQRGRDISATDAEVVAHAERLSRTRAVTVVTSDRQDIPLLVDLTRRPNIAVEFV